MLTAFCFILIIEDAFSGMDWMTEKIDLSEFDLDSLVGSCDADEAPTSPESLTSSLEPHMELDPQPEPSPFRTITEEVDVSLSEDLAFPSAAPKKMEVKIEPPSPVPSPSLPPSPIFTLDLGSEVDVSESEKTMPIDSTPVPKLILSFSPSLVLLLSPEEKLPAICSMATVTPDDHSDSDSGISSVADSLQHEPCLSPLSQAVGSCRTEPYSPSSKSAVSIGKVKSACMGTGTKVVEKKLKKMEQNKTAATRYRQKKRAEQEALVAECTELEMRNRELEERAESISKEIQYLKDLMEEVRNAKNRRSKGGNRVAS